MVFPLLFVIGFVGLGVSAPNPARQRQPLFVVSGCDEDGRIEDDGHGRKPHLACRASKPGSNVERMISDTDVCRLAATLLTHVHISSGKLTLPALHFLVRAFMANRLSKVVKACQRLAMG